MKREEIGIYSCTVEDLMKVLKKQPKDARIYVTGADEGVIGVPYDFVGGIAVIDMKNGYSFGITLLENF